MESSLERGLQRQPLDEVALARIRAATFEEFTTLTARARRTRLRRWSALAAALAIVAVGVWFLPGAKAPPGPLIGTIVRIERGELYRSDGLFRASALSPGAALRTGEQYHTEGAALIALAAGGTLRLAPGASFHADEINAMTLEVGRVYLDFAPGASPLTVQTPAGAVSHVGTQFEALLTDDATRVRVREGRVRVSGPSANEMAEKGTELTVSPRGEVSRRPIPTYGKDWEWVESLAPDYDIEGKPLKDFLGWVARETGRHIAFTDARVRDVAAQTVLHGTVGGLRPLEALERVLQTTSLQFELHDDLIRVSSRR